MKWLDQYHALEAAATAGPWSDSTIDTPDDVVIWASREHDDERFLCNVGGANPSQVSVVFDVDVSNSQLIVFLRNSAPKLARLVRAVDAVLLREPFPIDSELRAACAELDGEI